MHLQYLLKKSAYKSTATIQPVLFRGHCIFILANTEFMCLPKRMDNSQLSEYVLFSPHSNYIFHRGSWYLSCFEQLLSVVTESEPLFSYFRSGFLRWKDMLWF